MRDSAALALGAAASGPGDESGAAAVASKLAFEKFLLRLEVVMMYNTWLTVDQVRSSSLFLVLIAGRSVSTKQLLFQLSF
jgi:hypothetical protein